MAPAQDKPLTRGGAGPSSGATLARAACVALLLGLPSVLELPGALSATGAALAFSNARALVALGLLTGAAVSGRLSTRVRAGVRLVGGISAVAYVVLTGVALLGMPDVSIDAAIYLGFIASLVAGVAAFACGASWPCRSAKKADVDGDPALGVARRIAFALVSLGLLELSVGCEPRWTIAREAYATGGFDAANPWHVLAFGFSDIVGPGPHPLAHGVLSLDFRASFLLLAWLGVCLVASALDGRKARAAGISGLALGVVLARVVASLAPWLVEHGAAVGIAALAVGVALLAVCAHANADAKARAEDLLASKARASAPDLSPLSPREREAVEGRLAKKSSAEVAEQMGVSSSTVRNLQARAIKKLGVSSLDELDADGRASVQGEPKPTSETTSHALTFAYPILATAICFSCVVGSCAGGWTAVALAGEATSALALAVIAAAGGSWASASLIPTAAICGASLLAGVCVATIAVLVPPLVASASCMAFVFLLAVAAPIVGRMGFTPLGRGDMRTPATVFASCGAGIIVGSALVQPLLVGGELLALADSMAGVAAVASLASLALAAIVVSGGISLATIVRGVLAHRELSRVRAQAPSFDDRVRALCRLHGLNDTCADVVVQLLNGASGPQICESLHIAPGTLNSAKREVYRVFGIHSAAGLAARAIEQLGERA